LGGVSVNANFHFFEKFFVETFSEGTHFWRKSCSRAGALKNTSKRKWGIRWRFEGNMWRSVCAAKNSTIQFKCHDGFSA